MLGWNIGPVVSSPFLAQAGLGPLLFFPVQSAKIAAAPF